MNLRRVAAIMIALLAVGVLAFASGSSEKTATTGGKVTLKAMAYGDNSNQEGVSWVRITDAFKKANPNIDLQYEMLYDEAYHQKVAARLAAGDIPDFAYMGADARWGQAWKDAGQQVDHKPFLDTNLYDLSLIPPMGPNGEIWEIPLGTSNITTVLFVNKALLDSMGLAVPKTYADVVAMVPKAKAAGVDVISVDGADGWFWGSCLMSAIVPRVTGDPHWVSKAVAGQNKFNDPAFVQSLSVISQMVKDGVISKDAVLVDYGGNVNKFSNKQALMMIQGQWIAGSIDKAVADSTVMMPFPALPGEKLSGSAAAAIQVGYGLTKTGASKAAVRDAALKFLSVFYSEPETTQRLRDGAIVAPILKNYKVPDDMPAIVKAKVAMANQVAPKLTDVIDAFLAGDANDALNAGMQKIASGTASPADVAADVEKLVKR